MASSHCTKKEISLRTTFEQFGKLTLKSDFSMNDYDSKAEQCRVLFKFSANNLAAFHGCRIQVVCTCLNVAFCAECPLPPSITGNSRIK